MPRKVDLNQKAEELRNLLEKYGHVPSQKEDKKAYANLMYYFKRYADEPAIQNLITTYNIKSQSQTTREDIVAQLQEIGRIPSINDNQKLYIKIRYLFQNHSDDPEIVKLKYLYAHGSCFPLPNTKYPKIEVEEPYLGFIGLTPEWKERQENVSYEFIEYVFKTYSELPAPHTKPMEKLRKNIGHWERYNVDCYKAERNRLESFINRMIELGCQDTLIRQTWSSFKFSNPDVQQRVHQMVNENGACAIHYIAQTAIPGETLSDRFVYYYYYVQFNDKPDLRTVFPVGALYVYTGVHPERVLRVHYREYDQCDIRSIEKSARKYFRNWTENPPQTLSEWQHYGHCMFFYDVESGEEERPANGDSTCFDKTFIQKSLEAGVPYFRHYIGIYRFLDYYLFLCQNGYPLHDKEILEECDPCRVADDEHLTLNDAITCSKIIECLPNGIVDEMGGLYIRTEEGTMLLFIAQNVTEYKILNVTKIISRNATILCRDTLRKVTTPRLLRKNRCAFSTCQSLEQIIVHEKLVAKQVYIFCKKDATLFCNKEGIPYPIDPVIEGTKLVRVPFLRHYEIPDYVTEIDDGAFKESGVESVIIPGSIKEINGSVFSFNKNLKSVTIREGVKSLRGNVFWNCTNLRSIILPDSLEDLRSTFIGCESLKSIHLKKNLSYIDRETFKQCVNLEKIQIDGHLRFLGENAFESCVKLKSIEFKHGIQDLNDAFTYCRALKEIIFRGDYETICHYCKLTFRGCDNLEKIYVPAQYLDLFMKRTDSSYHHLLTVLQDR